MKRRIATAAHKLSASFISGEVKGKAAGQRTVTISKTRVLYVLNVPEQFVLAVAPIDDVRAAARRDV